MQVLVSFRMSHDSRGEEHDRDDVGPHFEERLIDRDEGASG
jgi:hypothetical protein